ncbi:unnamed protein product [Ranitomeya imitator]|uniref:Uncharacterized protein n=1 Tax=Ranitomeya imitator TaxID=111125 RepID=A0ABN9LQ01_9NEOB|nr:unnamed protein product [Ranitomeya imitator]
MAIRPVSIQPDLLKRLSCSDLSALQTHIGNGAKDRQNKNPWEERPKVISKSYHDLSQVAQSPQRRMLSTRMDSPPNTLEELMSRASFHYMGKSDTESVTGYGKLNESKSFSGFNRSLDLRKPDSDSSSVDDSAQAYVVDKNNRRKHKLKLDTDLVTSSQELQNIPAHNMDYVKQIEYEINQLQG